ncbi:RodZ domain-containing protein [Motiliproteus sp. SC1-56]|uniref:RodZ domain-containing protein n=1 Tax=Motiliproteus sp. SC1-56 TaxID=2799565 RepID=UPI001A8DD6E2|nr:RodZ domain-containing protein [Motiliproteus sp. SC1-56]
MTEIDPMLGTHSESGHQELPGKQLKAVREARGLSVQDVATRLNISEAYVSALEATDLSKLPGIAFVKGYMRAYARFVGLSGDELVAEIDRMVGRETIERPVTSINKVGQQAKLSDPLIRISVVLFAAALIAASLWWWQGQSRAPVATPEGVEAPVAPESDAAAAQEAASDPTDIQSRLSQRETESTPPEVSEPEAADEADEAEPTYLSPEEIERLSKELEAEGAAEPASAETASQAAPEAATAADTAERAATATEEKRLVMTFTDECWVAIRDQEDNLLYASNKKAGESLEFLVEEPARLLVGRVSAVSMAELGGEPLDLQSVARQNVARLTLD